MKPGRSMATMTPPNNDKIAEILNNGIIGLQDRIDTLNEQLEKINRNLEHILTVMVDQE